MSTERTSAEKYQFIKELYMKHKDAIVYYREHHISELNLENIKKEDLIINTENSTNEVELCSDESIAKTLANIINNSQDFKRRGL
ncbi:MAG TPA: hypothetical protein VFG10_09370 [Saprospiraceae bacterium]|nr:hypothetical protein [Saprospiraceae bacterium]